MLADAVPFFDSHAHLADDAFAADADEAIARMLVAGGMGVICMGESASAPRARALAARHPDRVWSTAGVHPHDAAAYDVVADGERVRAAVLGGAVAIGECGLDYHYDHSPRDLQRRAFGEQLRLASDVGRPAIVHTRDAADDTRAMLEEAAAAGVRGVLHCFTGPTALAESALRSGWYISFSGIVTFRTWTDAALLRLPPDDRLLVESDSPYLAPVPFRGKRNEPAFVRHTLQHVAQVRAIDPAVLGRVVCDNARRLFGLASPARES